MTNDAFIQLMTDPVSFVSLDAYKGTLVTCHSHLHDHLLFSHLRTFCVAPLAGRGANYTLLMVSASSQLVPLRVMKAIPVPHHTYMGSPPPSKGIPMSEQQVRFDTHH